jgi:hypothetical protein
VGAEASSSHSHFASEMAKDNLDEFQRRTAEIMKNSGASQRSRNKDEDLGILTGLDIRLREEAESARKMSDELRQSLQASHQQMDEAMKSFQTTTASFSSKIVGDNSGAHHDHSTEKNDFDRHHHEHFAKHKKNMEEHKNRMRVTYEELRSQSNNIGNRYRDGGHEFSSGDLHRFTNKGRPAFLGRDNDHSSTGVGETRALLESHGVSDAVIQEINRMAASKVPREHLVQHIRSHFPGKKTDDLNDIVVSALNAAHRDTPKSALDHAKKDELLFNAAKFQRNKASFESRSDL